MTTTAVVGLLAAMGAVAVVLGVLLLAGVGWALVAAGVLAVAAAVLFYDPDSVKKP